MLHLEGKPKASNPNKQKGQKDHLSQEDTPSIRNKTGNDNPAIQRKSSLHIPNHQGGLIPKKPQGALSSRDPGPGSPGPVTLLHLISPPNGPEGTSCGKFSLESHGAGADEELGPLPELGGIWWSCGWSPAVTWLEPCSDMALSGASFTSLQPWPA